MESSLTVGAHVGVCARRRTRVFRARVVGKITTSPIHWRSGWGVPGRVVCAALCVQVSDESMRHIYVHEIATEITIQWWHAVSSMVG